MKREILFRGKRLDNGRWVKGFYSNLYDEEKCEEQSIITYQKFYAADMSYPYPSVNTVDAEVDPETVGQLWMQIGKLKIFEGDVFEFPKHNVRFVVKYNEKRHQFCIAHPDELDLKYFNPWQCPDESWIEEFMEDAVLIGNIYDNKELLK